jgi:MFS family permease
MPTKKFTLKNGDADSFNIEISWKGLWKNTTVTCNGNEIGSFADQKELKAGKDFTLPDGGSLKVQLAQSFANAELQVLRDGKPVAGSASDPVERLKVAYGVIFFVAGLSITVGLVAELFEVAFLLRLGIGVGAMISGAVMGVLGYFVTRRSMAALGLAIGLFALDGILSLVIVAQQGGRPSVGGIVFRVFLIIPMVKGFSAIRELKAKD